jgi:hypothetical protein
MPTERRRDRRALNQQFFRRSRIDRGDLPAAAGAGLGTVGGFKLYVEDRAGTGFEDLYGQLQASMAKAQTAPSLAGLFSSFQVSVPQIDVDVDRERVKTYGVSLTDVFETLQVYLGSLYVNDFNRFGRTYQVNAQAAAGFRLQPEQIRQLQTRNDHGAMVPLGSLMTVTRGYGPDQVMHYNGYPAAEINGGPAPGFSSGQAQAAIADVLDKQLPPGMSFEWTELAYQELLAGNTMLLIFPLCVLLVYIVLAAQYESWTLPLTVILIVPMTLFSAIAGVWLTGGDNNVFTQISFPRARGPRVQERDSDRGVREAARDRGRVAPRRGARGVPHPAASDSDDLDGVHHGRRSAGLLLGRRLRNPTGDGHRRVRRHARRHALRPVPDSCLLHGDRPAEGPRHHQARSSSCADRQRRTGGRTLIMEPLSTSRLPRSQLPKANTQLPRAGCWVEALRSPSFSHSR